MSTNYTNRAKKAWRTRRANTKLQVNSYRNRAKKAWTTRHNNEIVANNEMFNQLSPAGKRVAIAKDVIAALQSLQVRARSGVWVDLKKAPANWDAGIELQPVFKQTNCEACALGACFVSAVKLGNNCKLTEDAKYDGFEFSPPAGDWGKDTTGMWTVLKRYFTERQLALIEFAFENGEGYYKYRDVANSEAANDFYYKYEDDEARMLAIMQNIVVNNGTFKP